MCLSIAVDRPADVLARGEHAGLEWIVTRNRMGYRCGYARVPRGHPWHGADFGAIDADVHGGLTFAEADVDCRKGGDDDAWWVGFDCGHGFDAPDPALITPAHAAAMAAIAAEVDRRMAPIFGDDWRDDLPPQWRDHVRTQEYVEAECRSLCEQAAAAAGGGP
jgi:hypothetical protein